MTECSLGYETNEDPTLANELRERAAVVKAKKEVGQALTLDERAVLMVDSILHSTRACQGKPDEQMDAIVYHLGELLPRYWENREPPEEDEDGEEEGADE